MAFSFVLARLKPQRTTWEKACLGRLGVGWVRRVRLGFVRAERPF